jgi:hypothetical protein
MHTETLNEYVDSRGAALRVDPAAGVIRGVKILGLESRNGRSYRPEALAAAAPLYEGAKVNVNHPKASAAAPRDYQDRLGAIRGVIARSEGLFGDLHYNPKHALAEQLAWDALHAPENVGFSHNVEARTARQGERIVVEAILRVASVDLVADPATTHGLFESHAEELGGPAAELASLRAEVERLRTAEALREKRLRVRRVLAEFRLPDPDAIDGAAAGVVGTAFVESLLATPDEAAMRRMIQERVELIRSAAAWSPARDARRPCSRDPLSIDPRGEDAKAFAAAIT